MDKSSCYESAVYLPMQPNCVAILGFYCQSFCKSVVGAIHVGILFFPTFNNPDPLDMHVTKCSPKVIVEEPQFSEQNEIV